MGVTALDREAEPRMPRKTTILVVDDSLVNLAVLDEILERQRFNVLLANNGKRALATARKEHPDLILLDVVMPGWDGFETCERIKSDPELAHIPILFLSGLGDTQNKVRALQAGGVDYVSKPFQEEELLARVRTHVELSRLRESLEEEVAKQTKQIRSLLEALQLSYQKTQETSLLKSQFLHNISHEFRTPMNIILGSMDELIEDTQLDDEQLGMANAVVRAGRQLMEILTNMLNFSQQFDGELRQKNVIFEPAALLNEVGLAFADSAAAKHLNFQYSAAPNIPATVRGNREYIRDTLNKLVHNAIKYTTAGTVDIRAMLAEGATDKIWISFSVHDTGLGIPEDKCQHLFEAFSQVDGSTTRAYDGMGMGLALAKLYVESMGGQIGVDSEQNAGSVFWFKIPLETAPPPTAP